MTINNNSILRQCISALFLTLSIFTILLASFFEELYPLMVANTLGCVIIIALYFKDKEIMLMMPSRLYALSIFSFLLARPLIAIFFEIDIVSVGIGVNDYNILITISYLLLSISATYIFFITFRFNKDFNGNFKFEYLCKYSNVIFSLFIFLGLLFLYKSYMESFSIGSTDYFDITNESAHFDHLKYFFWGKNICILWLLISYKSDNFFKASFLLMFFSLGFLLIGLRGYFISYLFLFLFFLNEKIKFKMLYILLSIVFLLIGSSFILEYRLGFPVFNNWQDMLIMPIYSQGATFEVMFGEVTFANAVSNCLSIGDYFFKVIPFGVCVDRARIVPFENGGFASSFFAEAYYLGIIVYLILSALIGLTIRFLDDILKFTKNKDNIKSIFFSNFILFLVIPNLVYFGRSSAFDLIIKLISTICILLIFFTIRLGRSK